RRKPLVIFDCGGGSTEFIWTNNKKRETVSINCGAVTLTDDYLRTDPPRYDEIYQLIKYIDNKFKVELQYIRELCKGTFSLVGTGGTVMNLAAMIHGVRETEFDEKLNGLVIKRKDIEILFTKMKGMPEAERLNLSSLEPGREDIVVAGTLMVIKIMDYFENKLC
ncbi:MAG: hypothetical protein JRF06_05580, partial [Deltaproteobacteria bacterium]|nr:hypothetical protein [Deltaproteobacteria bacterium]